MVNVISQVETIGDAYMVVGGLPKPCDNHAEKVAHMACSMMEASQKVLSPVDKTPLKVFAQYDWKEQMFKSNKPAEAQVQHNRV